MNIQDYIHLYLMCEVTGDYNDEPRKGYLTGVQNGGTECEIQFFEEDGFNVFEEPTFNETEKVKLLLRPFSDMTEAEMKEIYSIIFKREFPKSGRIQFHSERTVYLEPRWVLLSGLDRLGIEANGTVWADCDLHHYKHNQHEITRYLLSKSLDLFGLIEAGLATKKQ